VPSCLRAFVPACLLKDSSAKARPVIITAALKWIPHKLKSGIMSNVEILAQLPKLKAEERRQIYQRLCELQEQDVLNGMGPSEEEKKLLDAALAEYEKDQDRGRPWREVLGDLRARKAS